MWSCDRTQKGHQISHHPTPELLKDYFSLLFSPAEPCTSILSISPNPSREEVGGEVGSSIPALSPGGRDRGALPLTRERARPAADSPQNSISNSISVRTCSAEGDQGSRANEPRKSPPPTRAPSSRTCSSQLKYPMLHKSTETKKTAHLWMLAWGKSCPTAESRKNLASFPAVRNAWKKKRPTKTRSQPLGCVNRL